ncbi:MAG: MGMT family protein [Hyphomicrobium sp.]|nr:MGMT family protein [Hyphomicrobium sp.]
MRALLLTHTAVKRDLLARVRLVPLGHVTTVDTLARDGNVTMPLIRTVLANLTEDERDGVPWHRVVAKGGAIGRGPTRDAQFARLVREGVLISPAGVVQDLARVCLTSCDAATLAAADRLAAPRGAAGHSPSPQKSRGMRGQPSGSGGL